MPTKIRLQRHGKKGQPYYRIVVADSRAPRDGRFIENLGTYNPLTIPSTIEINQDRVLYWLQTGAQPTDTTRSILSYKGILYKNHLLKGVSKGALTKEQANMKFEVWKTEKEKHITNKIKEKELAEKNTIKKQQENEIKIKEQRAKSIAEKKAKISEKEKSSAPVSETEEIRKETPVAEAATTEQLIAEVKTEKTVDETPIVDEDKVEEPAVAKTKKKPKKEEPVITTEETPIAEATATE